MADIYTLQLTVEQLSVVRSLPLSLSFCFASSCQSLIHLPFQERDKERAKRELAELRFTEYRRGARAGLDATFTELAHVFEGAALDTTEKQTLMDYLQQVHALSLKAICSLSVCVCLSLSRCGSVPL
jgi:hypothetical protein